MQNKPNFQNAQMNTTACITRPYEVLPPRPRREYKPNQTQLQTQPLSKLLLAFTFLCPSYNLKGASKKLLLSRERAKFYSARRKVKIATGIAKVMPRTHFGLTTSTNEIAAVRSKNEFLEVPFILRYETCI